MAVGSKKHAMMSGLQTLEATFRGVRHPAFLLVLLTPFIAKLVIGGGWALAFIYHEHSSMIWLPSLGAGAAVHFVAVASIGRLVTARAWVKAAMVSAAVGIAFELPKLEFDPEYVLFKKNMPRYVNAIESDLAPHPKFKVFPLRELAGFPAGGTFYDIVYDESRELGLPETRRSPDWLASHSGFTSAGVRGRANPHATIDVRPLDGDFFLVVETY